MSDERPIEITADLGMEWQQDAQVYIARGNAVAKRGATEVHADTLTAHYRKSKGTGGDAEIYRLNADGHVTIKGDRQTVVGDQAVYDVDQQIGIVTGKDLKLTTATDVVTARDSLEWYDDKQLAVARGDAVAIREGKHLRGDVLTASVTRAANEASHISRVDAHGNVLVSSQDQIARGDAGVYNVDTGIATLTGRVTLTRADNELRGQYAVVDLNNNVSRLLSAPPSTQLTEGKPARVQGLLVPRQKPAAPAQ